MVSQFVTLVNMGVMEGPRIYATGLGFCRVAGR